MDRRRFLQTLGVSSALTATFGAIPASIARALDVPANNVTGTLMDVEHVVILTQENRSFDHYFGTLNGVRGFADRFAIPGMKGQTIWSQPEDKGLQTIAPFRLNTVHEFKYMRVTGTPHTFPDAQTAWDNGRMSAWPKAKHNHSLGYFTREDIPFQFALAEAFTLCDAYHCAMHAGTNPNRTYLWTGTNDPNGDKNGPVIDNGYDHLGGDPLHHGGYDWTTYPERLQAAGISWQIYQDMDDNFTDNPLAGFKRYRTADKAADGLLAELARRSIRSRGLELLKADVMADKLPQVSWIIATAEGSEHPGPSSPAQGADYTAQVLEALTINPDVWSKTVLLINFDENDGFFDHMPPPCAPSKFGELLLGESQIETTGEYHLGQDAWQGRPYGPGPRVPLYVISPWSKGGYVNSEVFDHTSIIRFLEARFGVKEPNISSYRRAVCGDLMSCFDFKAPNRDDFFQALPETQTQAAKAHKLGLTATPPLPDSISPPVQEKGLRPARALPYVLEANLVQGDAAFYEIELINRSPNAVVFHIYGLQLFPSRYVVKAGGCMSAKVVPEDSVQVAHIIGPNGFHRTFSAMQPKRLDIRLSGSALTLINSDNAPIALTIQDESYGVASQSLTLAAGGNKTLALELKQSHNWYDISLQGDGFAHRLAGHIENGQPSFSDPALSGPATLRLWSPS